MDRSHPGTLCIVLTALSLSPIAAAQPSHHGGGHDRWNRIASRLMGASNMSTVPVGNYKFDVSYVSNSPNGERLFFFKSPASSPYGQGQQAGSCMSVGLQRNTPSAPFTYIVTVGSQSGATTNLGPQPGSPPFRSLAEAVERCVAWSGVSIDEASAPQAARPAPSAQIEQRFIQQASVLQNGLRQFARPDGTGSAYNTLDPSGNRRWEMRYTTSFNVYQDPTAGAPFVAREGYSLWYLGPSSQLVVACYVVSDGQAWAIVGDSGVTRRYPSMEAALTDCEVRSGQRATP